MSDGSEEEDVVAVIPVPRKAARKAQPAPALATAATPTKGSLKKSPQSSKVGDGDDAFFPSTSPQFTNGGGSGSTPSRQFGRHAGANSIGSEDDEVGGLSSKKKHQQQHAESRRPSVKLQPSSAQKKKGSVIDTGGKKAPAKEYVASRVWKNESTMTFGMRVKLAENPEMWSDANFAATNIVDVWEHYSGKNDEMGRHEVTNLANDLVDRFIAIYREQLIVERPSLDDKGIQKAISKDVFPHLLPGENIVEAKRTMCDRLFRELDLDSDGHITKIEFMMKVRQPNTISAGGGALSARPPSNCAARCVCSGADSSSFRALSDSCGLSGRARARRC